MENPKVKFRRGGSDLPETVTDGYITLNAENGKMYADILENRKAISGYLFGVSSTPADTALKIVEIPGVPEYFDGLILTVVFEHLDKEMTDTLQLSVCYGDIALPATNLMIDPTTNIAAVDIEEGIPYSFAYQDGVFVLISGNLGARPKWKTLFERKGF